MSIVYQLLALAQSHPITAVLSASLMLIAVVGIVIEANRKP